MKRLARWLAAAALFVLAPAAWAQGVHSLPTTQLSVFASPMSGLIPLRVTFVLLVEHDGRLPLFVVFGDCKDGTRFESPETAGLPGAEPNQAFYTIQNGCTYTSPGDYQPEIDVYQKIAAPAGGYELRHVQWFVTPILHATAPISLPSIVSAGFTPAQAARPASSVVIGADAAGGRTPWTYRIDLDDNCGAETNCQAGCFETPLGAGDPVTGDLAAAALPDFTDLGTRFANLCLYDGSVPSVSAVRRVSLEVLEQSIDVALTAIPNEVIGTALDDVVLQATVTGDATGIGTAPGGYLKFCAFESCSSGVTEDVLYTNPFDNCTGNTGTSGVFTCPATPSGAGPQGGTVALVGQTAGGTNLIRFGQRWTAQPDLFLEWSMRVTTEGLNQNQALFRTRYGTGTGPILIRRASTASDTLSIERNGTVCGTSSASAYTVGTWATYKLHVNTATGAIELLKDGGDTPIATCGGDGTPTPFDGFELIVGNAIAEFDHVEASTVDDLGDSVLEVSGATANPFNTQTHASRNFDGYTTGTTRAKVEACFGTAPCATAFAEISVEADETFALANVTPQVTQPCIAGTCQLLGFTFDAEGTATGDITGIELERLGSGLVFEDGETDEDEYDAALDGFVPVDLDLVRTETFILRADREGKPAQAQFQVTVSEPVEVTTDLVASPNSVQQSTPHTVNGARQCVEIRDLADCLLPYTCSETSPWISIASGAEGAAPQQLCIDFVNVAAGLTPGQHNATIECSRIGAPTDEADIAVQLLVQAPAPSTPWIDAVDSQGRAVLDTGTSLGVVTMHKTEKLSNQSGLTTRNSNFSNSYASNALLWGSTFDRLGGRPKTSVCYPASTCGGDDNDRDALHMPWGASASQSLKAKIVYKKWLTAENSWAARTTCNSTTNCPHMDDSQGLAQGACSADYWIDQDNIYRDSDSGQQYHDSGWEDGDQAAVVSACDLKVVLYQNTAFLQTSDFIQGCLAREAAIAAVAPAANATRDCNKIHANIANNGDSHSSEWSIWLVGVVGNVKGGTTSRPVQNRIVRVQTSAGQTTGIVGTPTYVDYANLELAIAGETAAGQPVPPFLRKSCAGWASPPNNCTPINQRGDQD